VELVNVDKYSWEAAVRATLDETNI
jgi:hypothetical protein